MPAGLQDQDGDGLIDEYFNGSHAPANLTPETWTVNFDACDTVEGSSAVVEYRWAIDGDDAGASASCDGFSYQFPAEGVYEVTLTAVDLEAQESSVTHSVTVQDWLIVSLGDSYGSGEGNPDSPISDDAYQNYQDALADLQQANQELNNALQELVTADSEYVTRVEENNDVRDARAALNAANASRNNLCNPLLHPFVLLPGSEDFVNCADATALVNVRRLQLLNALTEVGLQALIDSIAQIEEALDELEAVALAAVNVAQNAVNVAQAGLGVAQNLLATAQGELTPEWQDERCHRSSVAGSAQAALMIEEADPRTSVTFVHLACSGAKITTGLVGGYEGAESAPGDPLLTPQVQESALMVDGREVDAMYMSIGGNDANFAPIIEACIVQQTCQFTPTLAQTGLAGIRALHCAALSAFGDDCEGYFERMEEHTTTGLEYYEQGIAQLEPSYSDLAGNIGTYLPNLQQDRVYISEYPSAVQDDDGTYCPDATDPNPLSSLPGISLAEMTWADETVASAINDEIAAATATHGWKFVGGIYAGSAGHGYCADDHWMVRIQESFLIQGDEFGTAHPSAAGHALYAQQIFASLMDDFYPTGDLSLPRQPIQQEEPAEPVEVTDELEQDGDLNVSYDPTPVANAPGGVYTISGTGTNVSDTSFVEVIFIGTFLTDGCVFLNTDSGTPQGAGATMTLSGDDFGDDGILSPGESFTTTVHVGLATSPPFQLSYEVWAVPAP